MFVCLPLEMQGIGNFWIPQMALPDFQTSEKQMAIL